MRLPSLASNCGRLQFLDFDLEPSNLAGNHVLLCCHSSDYVHSCCTSINLDVSRLSRFVRLQATQIKRASSTCALKVLHVVAYHGIVRRGLKFEKLVVALGLLDLGH